MTASGVTDADLVEQFQHNQRVLRLVNDTAFAVARINAAQARLKTSPDAARAQALQRLSEKLITPRIRYSAPGLQSHVNYLYGETTETDQKVGRDAVERYATLRREVDAAIADLNAVLGPPTEADFRRYAGTGS